MNGHYLAQAAPNAFRPALQDAEKETLVHRAINSVIELLKTRVRTVPAILEEGAYF